LLHGYVFCSYSTLDKERKNATVAELSSLLTPQMRETYQKIKPDVTEYPKGK